VATANRVPKTDWSVWLRRPEEVWVKKDKVWKTLANPALGTRKNPLHVPFPMPPAGVSAYAVLNLACALAAFFLRVLSPAFNTDATLMLGNAYLVLAIWGGGLLMDGSVYTWHFEFARCNGIALLALLAHTDVLTPFLPPALHSLFPKPALVWIGVFHALQFVVAGVAGTLQPRFREADELFTKYRGAGAPSPAATTKPIKAD
jgi:hypothetical protein